VEVKKNKIPLRGYLKFTTKFKQSWKKSFCIPNIVCITFRLYHCVCITAELPDLDTPYQKGKKYTELPQNLPSGQKLPTPNDFKLPTPNGLKIPNLPFLGLKKNYQKQDFWHANIWQHWQSGCTC
jgi:hypothetical protein